MDHEKRWEDTVKIGEIGQAFVMSNLNELLEHWMAVWQRDTEEDHIEGGDAQIRARMIQRVDLKEWLQEKPEEDCEPEAALSKEDVNNIISVIGISEDEALLLLDGINGSVELKTRTYQQLVWRDDNDYDCGTIQFAIWNSYANESIRTHLGSLYKMFYPREPEEGRKVTEVTPHVYMEILLDANKRPFACIAFEDFPALRNRLIELASKHGIPLDREGFKAIPRWEIGKDPNVWANQINGNRYRNKILITEMWHVPFSDVVDLATITMIGETPEVIREGVRVPVEMQKKRLAFLEEHSHGRRIPCTYAKKTEYRVTSPILKLI